MRSVDFLLDWLLRSVYVGITGAALFGGVTYFLDSIAPAMSSFHWVVAVAGALILGAGFAQHEREKRSRRAETSERGQL